MAFRSLKLLRFIRCVAPILQNVMPMSVTVQSLPKITKPKEYKTEDNLIFLEDPDAFGTLKGRPQIQNDELEDEDDMKEQQYLENIPLKSQRLTTKQYADLIKQYLQQKRLKEAIDVLEIRMLKVDRVKPENYIYNILIGACAEVGYTKKAFKLFNDMKRRALKPTGDTYTCLFEACTNSPWITDGLSRAKNLRDLMLEKGIEPNLTNYNAMIKAFGRCGDVTTAFKIVDEMTSKKIKIRVHTFNHLLHTCISDKENGLRHALVVWRKMLKQREKPNIYSFNLMLKCVRECNLGSKADIEELIQIIQELSPTALNPAPADFLQIEGYKNSNEAGRKGMSGNETDTVLHKSEIISSDRNEVNQSISEAMKTEQTNTCNIATLNELVTTNKPEITIELLNRSKVTKSNERTVPNLLSKTLKLNQVLSLQEVHTLQDKFAIIGGQEDFIKEMETYSVKPDIKVFTQMLPLIEESIEAESKLLETMKAQDIKADIDFYNMLIKKRCLRYDYDGAFAVKEIIEKESKHRKRKYPLKKKLALKVNIMTYGVLAMACKTKEQAQKLLDEMKEKQLKVNIEILGALLKQATENTSFGYVMHVMNVAKEENIKVSPLFLKHLEGFNDRCSKMLENVKLNNPKHFEGAYRKFLSVYSDWLKKVDINQALEPEHPWQQFREMPPDTVQRQNNEIIEPRRFYKRNRKYVPYAPRV